MPDYSIYVLGEDDLTISGGGQLDGVTQGDGSHLEGLTLTLNSNAWGEVFITDDDDDFRDNDSSQRLNGAQTINGDLYDDDTIVEAEYGLTLTDGTNTWQVVGFNLRTTSPSYGTVEGLAFIGGPGGFPPVGVPLLISDAQEGPDFEVTEYATPICYDRGTLIETPYGPCPIEDLVVGDLVNTADRGAQTIRWAGARPAIGAGVFAPVEIPAGLLGATRPLRVSQQHRLLVCDAMAELLFGRSEVFVTARHLAEQGLARLLKRRPVCYHHLLLDHHAVIRANGVASESLHLGDCARRQGAFFPELGRFADRAGALARPALRRHEATLLLSQCSVVDTKSKLRHSA